ncbi:MAG TPA: 16S rRNA (adenine(1518)-N(6)/adenine(1519)-N(6))-dimethyltransferase RsmA [Candidatus Baltobacteraceae bacterium]|nr:16S rRNA (adenine(1518)-N(6)/adenine(1519)-N(6))-dimethyltransferase RsmA [Candidatus Baltobacteraceae bacterium]
MDAAAAGRIARLACEDAAPGTPVVEIGAGTGTLTFALLEAGARVCALEIDPALVAILNDRGDLAAADIVRTDAMTYDYASFAQSGPWRAAGNLPYNIATPLLMQFVEMEGGPERIVAMIQKDVADRIDAKPSTPAYGSLSLAVQRAMRVERAFTLGPRAFYPAPKVDSTVVSLTRRNEPLVAPHDLELFRKVVRGAFAYRRKTLVNSLTLALGLDRNAIAQAIAASGLPAESRGEQLDLQAFCRLADLLAQR